MPETIKILLVEDEAMTAKLLTRNLELVGYDVAGPVATGEAAIEMAAEERPSVVLMDVRLAGKIDGIEAAEKIVSLYETHIVFMTGYSDEDVRIRAQVLQPAAYLVKPVTPDDVQPVIDELFGQQKKNDPIRKM